MDLLPFKDIMHGRIGRCNLLAFDERDGRKRIARTGALMITSALRARKRGSFRPDLSADCKHFSHTKKALDEGAVRSQDFRNTKTSDLTVNDLSVEEAIRGPDQAFGARLRMRRRELGLTLKEVADGAGLSVGFISQIERGITTPSLSSLASVSRVLKVPLSEFLTQPAKTTSPATRHGQRPHFAIGGNSLVYERLSASFPGCVLRTLIIHEPPGHRSEPISHDGEEIFYILDGSLTVEVGADAHILETGDSIHFPSKLVHSSWNHTTRPATILHTCTMDVFGDADADNALEAPAVSRTQDRLLPTLANKKPKGK